MLLNGPILTSILGLKDCLLVGAVARAVNHLSGGLQLAGDLIPEAQNLRLILSLSYT